MPLTPNHVAYDISELPPATREEAIDQVNAWFESLPHDAQDAKLSYAPWANKVRIVYQTEVSDLDRLKVELSTAEHSVAHAVKAVEAYEYDVNELKAKIKELSYD